MSRRNVWLKFDEWELINKELSDQKYHRFQLSKRQVDEWRKDIKKYPHRNHYKFERTGVYPAIEQVKSPRAVNILCRENWRSQDMYSTMRDTHDFIGFIINHVDDVNMDTTVEEWDDIRNKMRHLIENSDKRIWFYDELIELYNEVAA
jgi:hypothetical protein